MKHHKTKVPQQRTSLATMMLSSTILLGLSLSVVAGPSEAPWGAGGRSVVLVAAPLAGEQQARLRASPAFPARRRVAACSRRVFPWWQLRAGCDCAAALDHSLRRLARWAREARGMPTAVLSALHPRDAAAEPIVLTMSLPHTSEVKKTPLISTHEEAAFFNRIFGLSNVRGARGPGPPEGAGAPRAGSGSGLRPTSDSPSSPQEGDLDWMARTRPYASQTPHPQANRSAHTPAGALNEGAESISEQHDPGNTQHVAGMEEEAAKDHLASLGGGSSRALQHLLLRQWLRELAPWLWGRGAGDERARPAGLPLELPLRLAAGAPRELWEGASADGGESLQLQQLRMRLRLRMTQSEALRAGARRARRALAAAALRLRRPSLFIIRSMAPLSEESLSTLLGDLGLRLESHNGSKTCSDANEAHLVAVVDGCPTVHDRSLQVFIHGAREAAGSQGAAASLPELTEELRAALHPHPDPDRDPDPAALRAGGVEELTAVERAAGGGGGQGQGRVYLHVARVQLEPCGERMCIMAARRTKRGNRTAPDRWRNEKKKKRFSRSTTEATSLKGSAKRRGREQREGEGEDVEKEDVERLLRQARAVAFPSLSDLPAQSATTSEDLEEKSNGNDGKEGKEGNSTNMTERMREGRNVGASLTNGTGEETSSERERPTETETKRQEEKRKKVERFLHEREESPRIGERQRATASGIALNSSSAADAARSESPSSAREGGQGVGVVCASRAAQQSAAAAAIALSLLPLAR